MQADREIWCQPSKDGAGVGESVILWGVTVRSTKLLFDLLATRFDASLESKLCTSWAPCWS